MVGEALDRAILQRADWRFLLPRVRAVRSICFAGGALAQAVDLISAACADAANPEEGECDLAVAVDPDASTLSVAATALAPGGWCYTEWHSPLAGGARAIRARLATAGLSEVACYSPWPSPARGRTRLWVPLGAPGALRYFLASRPAPRRLLARLARALVRRAWGLAAGKGLVFPVCAVARKPSSAGPSDDAAIAPAFHEPPLALIRTRWSSWGFGPTPRRLSWLVLTLGVRLENKVVGLVFAEPDARLRIVVKLVRVPEVGQRLRREALTLTALESLRPGGVPGVPRLLFCEDHGNGPALGETALDGVRLFTWVNPRNARELGLKVTDWLLRLVREGDMAPPSEWWDRLVEPVLAEFQTLYASVVSPTMFTESVRRLRTLGPLPSAIEHRDFGWWNVLLSRENELAVLDWETSEVRGLPGLDLFYFLYFLAALLDGSNRDVGYRETYRSLMDASTATGRIHAECIDRYMAGAGLDPTSLHPLRLLTWMFQACSDYRDIVDRSGGDPTPDDLRKGLYFALWQEELRHGTGS